MQNLQSAVWAIGVAFQPDTARLDATLESIIPQVTGVIVVDNTPNPPAELLRYWQDWTRRGVVVLRLGRNLGIAAAQNLGARHALRRLGFPRLHEEPSGKPRETSGMVPHEKSDENAALLFFDQDSVFAPDYVAQIQAEYDRMVGNIGALGGLAFDHRESDPARRDVLAYRDTTWGPRRYPDATLRKNAVLPAAFLIASGLYVPVAVWQQVGPMDGEMFIDHVDLEWCRRADNLGLGCLLVTGAHIDHRLGDEVVKLPGRAQVVHVHSPFRVYYLVRNTCWLIRGRVALPAGWRWGYVLWLAKFVAFNLVFAPGRAARLGKIRRGLRDGCLVASHPRFSA